MRRACDAGGRGTLERVPAAFCWTRMGTEAGQPLSAILRRKELERQSGDGVFFWGTGTALGVGIRTLVEEIAHPQVLFSPMRAKPREADINPTQLVAWLRYRGSNGEMLSVPSHTLVTSRGETLGGKRKHVHYALVCRADRSLEEPCAPLALPFAAVQNLSTGRPVGFSQVTAVVRARVFKTQDGHSSYPVDFVADLVSPHFVRLACPVVVPAELVREIARVSSCGTVDEWSLLVKSVRADGESQLNRARVSQLAAT